MLSHLLTFLLSILSGVIAWLLTVKAGDSFKQKPWSRIVLILAVFGIVFLALTTLQKAIDQPAAPQSSVNSKPVVSVGSPPERRLEPEKKRLEPANKPIQKNVVDSVPVGLEFTTESYKFTVNSLQRNGIIATAEVTLESLSTREIYFTIVGGSCYLVDENGERWTMEGHDPARFVEAGSYIVPETKIKSKFSFTALNSNIGSEFALICTEASPGYGRKIVVRKLSFE